VNGDPERRLAHPHERRIDMHFRMPSPLCLYVFTTLATLAFAAIAFAAPATYRIDPADICVGFDAVMRAPCRT
jgi:hypothetical protein